MALTKRPASAGTDAGAPPKLQAAKNEKLTLTNYFKKNQNAASPLATAEQGAPLAHEEVVLDPIARQPAGGEPASADMGVGKPDGVGDAEEQPGGPKLKRARSSFELGSIFAQGFAAMSAMCALESQVCSLYRFKPLKPF